MANNLIYFSTLFNLVASVSLLSLMEPFASPTAIIKYKLLYNVGLSAENI